MANDELRMTNLPPIAAPSVLAATAAPELEFAVRNSQFAIPCPA
jgi:hypothetical protein